MSIQIECNGTSPLLMHSDRASDPLSKEAQWLSEISGKRQKTEAEIIELARREFHCSLYLDTAGRPTIPIDNVHSCLYAAAKRRKEGPLFSGSFTVSSVRFDYEGPDEADALWEEQEQFVDRRSVKVGTSRVIRTRAIFPAWSLSVTAEHDPDVADLFNIRQWADIAGARIGLGDLGRPRPDWRRLEAVLDADLETRGIAFCPRVRLARTVDDLRADIGRGGGRSLAEKVR